MGLLRIVYRLTLGTHQASYAGHFGNSSLSNISDIMGKILVIFLLLTVSIISSGNIRLVHFQKIPSQLK